MQRRDNSPCLHFSSSLVSTVTRLGYFWTWCNFSKPLATINLPKYPTFLGNFCKGVKIYHFSSEIIFGQLYRHLAIFSSLTVGVTHKSEIHLKNFSSHLVSLSFYLLPLQFDILTTNQKPNHQRGLNTISSLSLVAVKNRYNKRQGIIPTSFPPNKF